MKNIFFLLILSTLLLNGCVNVNARLEFEKSPENNLKNVPFKFYVTSLQVNNLSMQSIDEFRKKFIKYWPELFTLDQEKSIPVNFSLSIKSNDIFDDDAFFSLLVSFLSYGLIPAIDNYEYQIPISVHMEFKSKTLFLKESGRRSANAGVLGIFLTRYLVPDVKNATFHNNSKGSKFVIYANKEKDFFKLFVDVLSSFQRDELLQYYYSQKINKTQLLR